MVEFGWTVCNAITNGGIQTSLIALKEGQTIPGRILSLIGIKEEELASAPSEAEVLSSVRSSLPTQTIFLAHYARFEQGFLKDHFDFAATPIFCTYEIARRLFPDLPSRSIRAVSGFLGHHIGEAKRSIHHIEATYHIWRKLVPTLKEAGIFDFQSLTDWLKEPPAKRRKKNYALAADIRLKMPDKPGVYKMLGHDGRVLYVGKATSLKSRVNSYFRGQKTKGSRINELVSQIVNIDVHVTHSSLEAALVEADAIKSLNPPYNRAQKAYGRAIGYTDSQMRTSAIPERYGPFSSMKYIESISQLKNAIEDASIIPENNFEFDLDTLKTGLEIFRTRIQRNDDGSLNWKRTLCQMWIEYIQKKTEQRLLALEEEEEEEEEETAEEDEVLLEEEIEADWTPEEIATYFYGAFTSYAAGVHRGRWLTALANCMIRWQEKKTEKCFELRVRNGVYQFVNIEDCYENFDESGRVGDSPHGGQSPTSPTRFAITDLSTYDRMRVLFSELRRLLHEAKGVTLYLDNDRKLSSLQIKKFVFPGDFDEEN